MVTDRASEIARAAERRREREQAARTMAMIERGVAGAHAPPVDLPPPVEVDLHQAWTAVSAEWGFPRMPDRFDLAKVETRDVRDPERVISGAWPVHRGHCAGEWGAEPWCWTFVGPKGTGKTFAAVEVAARVWRTTLAPCEFVTGPALVEELQAPRWGPGALPDRDRMTFRALRAPVLVIDDLVVQSTGAAKAQVHRSLRSIVHSRHQARARTIVTAHVGFSKPLAAGLPCIATWDDMIFERLREGCVAAFVHNKRPDGPDF
jgi:hypothetical protein